MKFSHKEGADKYYSHIDFSEIVNGKEIFVTAYGNNNSVSLIFDEKNIRRLHSHLSNQLKALAKIKREFKNKSAQ